MSASLRPLAVIAASVLSLSVHVARADWPDHAVRWIVPFAPGGANDLMARAAAEGVSKLIKQPIVIENKPGAGAAVGADYVAKSKPDGYTFLIGAAGTITNSMIRKDMPYQDSDLVPVGMIAVAQFTPLPPRLFAHAMNSFMLPAGMLGCTTITEGATAIMPTGTKSLSAYGSDLCSRLLDTRPAAPIRNV